jgi:hypothetical protein
VLCEVGAEYEEVIDDLNIKAGADCFPCEIRTEANETAGELSISTGHDLL